MKMEQVFITCDECNAIDASELRFAVNGRNYAIDLCEMHRAIFDTLIATYITNGHPVRFNHNVVRKDGNQNAPKAMPTDQTVKPKRARKSRAKATPIADESIATDLMEEANIG